MDEKMQQQANPSAPVNHGYQRRDGESLLSTDELKQKNKFKLAMYIVGILIVVHLIVGTVIRLTVMKVKTPKARLGNIYVENLNSVPATPSFYTNFTTQIRVKNTNWGPYKFEAGTVEFLYKGVTVGEVVIPKSKAGMLSTKKIDVKVGLSSNGLRSRSNLGNDLNSGVLMLSTSVYLLGEVELMVIMKYTKYCTMDCTIAFDLSSKTVKTLQCK